MRYEETTIVLVPWFDTDGNKNWFNFKFKGSVDRRRIYREVIRHVKRALNRQVSKRFLRENVRIIPQDVPQTEKETLDAIEAFIQRMEYNEDEDQPDCSGAGSTLEETGRTMCALPNTN